MRRRRSSVALLVTLAIAAGFGGGACGRPSSSGTLVEPTLQLETEPGVGPVLTGPDGSPLYFFTADQQRRATCTGGCSHTWIPLDVPDGAAAQGGPGVQAALLGTVASPAGGRQITYNCWPLYTYLGDRTTFSLTGDGIHSFGGTWWAITAAGNRAGPGR